MTTSVLSALGGGGGGASTTGNDMTNLFLRAASSGGLYSGCFKHEPVMALLRVVEKVCFDVLSQFHRAVQTYHPTEPDEYARLMAPCTKFVKEMNSAQQDTLVRMVEAEHQQAHRVLSISFMVYVRETYQHTAQRDQLRFRVRMPPMRDFIYEVVVVCAQEPFVLSGEYFALQRMIERKIIHMDAIRSAFEKLAQSYVIVRDATPPRRAAADPDVVPSGLSPRPDLVPAGRRPPLDLVPPSLVHRSPPRSNLARFLDEQYDVAPEDSISNQPDSSPFVRAVRAELQHAAGARFGRASPSPILVIPQQSPLPSAAPLPPAPTFAAYAAKTSPPGLAPPSPAAKAKSPPTSLPATPPGPPPRSSLAAETDDDDESDAESNVKTLTLEKPPEPERRRRRAKSGSPGPVVAGAAGFLAPVDDQNFPGTPPVHVAVGAESTALGGDLMFFAAPPLSAAPSQAMLPGAFSETPSVVSDPYAGAQQQGFDDDYEEDDDDDGGEIVSMPYPPPMQQ